jgi:hypothetical protein
MAVPVLSDDGDDLKFFEVSHAVQDWSKLRAERRTPRFSWD